MHARASAWCGRCHIVVAVVFHAGCVTQRTDVEAIRGLDGGVEPPVHQALAQGGLANASRAGEQQGREGQAVVGALLQGADVGGNAVESAFIQLGGEPHFS